MAKYMLALIVMTLLAAGKAPAVTKGSLYCEQANGSTNYMIGGFLLDVDRRSAKIQVLSDDQSHVFQGTLAPNQVKSDTRYIGFDGLIPEYELSLIVSKSVMQGRPGIVRLNGRGEAFITQVYNCLPRIESSNP